MKEGAKEKEEIWGRRKTVLALLTVDKFQELLWRFPGPESNFSRTPGQDHFTAYMVLYLCSR